MNLKSTLRAITLELRRELEGKYDAQGNWQPGDLERRLASIGVRRDRPPVPADELTLSGDDREARKVVDAFVCSRSEAGQRGGPATADFVREAAYGWANRLLALRCMEARGLIDEVVLQKDAYGGRSLQHHRLTKKEPERCSGEDEGLFAALFDEFTRRAQELPLLFEPKAPEVVLRPSVAALKRCIALLSGTRAAKGQDAATDGVFTAPDALGWTYHYWNTDEKDRVFKKASNRSLPKEQRKISGPDIAPATCIYTERYMVKFLVQNSLGATWMGMTPGSRLWESWEYYVRDADRAPDPRSSVSEITFLDPACGSGHFLLEAFELYYAMYLEEGVITEPAKICAAILERNLYGIDIDERAVQIAALALVMKAKEKAPDFLPRQVNLVATNIRLSASKEHLESFLRKHPEDEVLKPALLAVFEGLAHADEIGSLLQIEEPVDRELRRLRNQQLARERKAGARTLFGPREDEEWSAWRHEVVDRLREHFSSDTGEGDLAAAFFGAAASKGLSLLDLLARRYDVVVANPPYMGSKNMGPVIKTHVERHFKAGKRDLATAFVLRCRQLATTGGRVAVVVPESWMFLSSYQMFRGLVLEQTSIEALAQLGRHAFAEADPPNNVSLVSFATTPPTGGHRPACFRVAKPAPASEQAATLWEGTTGRRTAIVFRPEQAKFKLVRGAPFAYWLRDRFFTLLAGRTLGSVSGVSQGLATAEDGRFVRFAWEVPLTEWRKEAAVRRWAPFEKGGGYGKWAGHNWWTVEWEHRGARIPRARARVQNESRFFLPGWSYSLMARGSMGCRFQAVPSIIGHKGPGIYGLPRGYGALLNARPFGYVVRAFSPNPAFEVDSVARGPVPDAVPSDLAALERAAVCLKGSIVSLDATERTFRPAEPRQCESLDEFYGAETTRFEAMAAVLHLVEGLAERVSFAAYGLDDADTKAVLEEMGTPAGWWPVLDGYSRWEQLVEELGVEGIEVAPGALTVRTAPPELLRQLKERLRKAYEAGPGGSRDGLPDDGETEDEDNADDGRGDGADEPDAPASTRKPVPAETFVEELSAQLEVHPVSLVLLLRELRRDSGLVCAAQRKAFLEDYFSYLVLRIVGHRWPVELEELSSPSGCDVIPVLDGTGVPSLLSRVRDQLQVTFGAHSMAAEHEFDRVVGVPLPTWLLLHFFSLHVSKFKKRPIVWQVQSRGSGGGVGSIETPAFACIFSFHALTSDLLPRIRTQYVSPQRVRLQTELTALERFADLSASQDQRRYALQASIEELLDLEGRLHRVSVAGFDFQGLESLARAEPLDRWTSHDGRSKMPPTHAELLAQERRYDPDLNDGVRVNLAPLERAGVLASTVLGASDLEAPLKDRAVWRTEERRLCREQKLTAPGWWLTDHGRLT